MKYEVLKISEGKPGAGNVNYAAYVAIYLAKRRAEIDELATYKAGTQLLETLELDHIKSQPTELLRRLRELDMLIGEYKNAGPARLVEDLTAANKQAKALYIADPQTAYSSEPLTAYAVALLRVAALFGFLMHYRDSKVKPGKPSELEGKAKKVNELLDKFTRLAMMQETSGDLTQGQSQQAHEDKAIKAYETIAGNFHDKAQARASSEAILLSAEFVAHEFKKEKKAEDFLGSLNEFFKTLNIFAKLSGEAAQAAKARRGSTFAGAVLPPTQVPVKEGGVVSAQPSAGDKTSGSTGGTPAEEALKDGVTPEPTPVEPQEKAPDLISKLESRAECLLLLAKFPDVVFALDAGSKPYVSFNIPKRVTGQGDETALAGTSEYPAKQEKATSIAACVRFLSSQQGEGHVDVLGRPGKKQDTLKRYMSFFLTPDETEVQEVQARLTKA
jgi:hypothetical protein